MSDYKRPEPFWAMIKTGVAMFVVGIIFVIIGAFSAEASGITGMVSYGLSWYFGLTALSLGVTVTLVGVSIGVLVRSLKG